MNDKWRKTNKINIYEYNHKIFQLNSQFKINRLLIVSKYPFAPKVIGLEFVAYVSGRYFPLLKMKRSLLTRNFYVSQILYLKTAKVVNQAIYDKQKKNLGVVFCQLSSVFSNLLSFNCPRQEILQGITDIILNDESKEHFYILKDRIHAECQNRKYLARCKYLKLLFVDMWLLTEWSKKIWLPYLSKITYVIHKILIYLIQAILNIFL